MMVLLVEDKKIVVPGEKLAEGMDHLPGDGTYRKDKDIFAEKLGLLHVSGRALKIIPLSGRYSPKRDDIIVGKVFDITMSGWRVEFGSAYSAMLSMRDASYDFIAKGADLTKYFNLGDYLVAKIINVTSQKLIDISTKGPGLKKLVGGRVFKVNSSKVPRIIGKQGSMVKMIKEATGCLIVVGQNGWVWIKGDPKQEVLVYNTIKKIEEESHISGLTDRMKKFLEKNKVNIGNTNGGEKNEL